MIALPQRSLLVAKLGSNQFVSSAAIESSVLLSLLLVLLLLPAKKLPTRKAAAKSTQERTLCNYTAPVFGVSLLLSADEAVVFAEWFLGQPRAGKKPVEKHGQSRD